MSTTRSQPPAPPPDLRVGDYRLLSRIGEGGMGVVHLAQAPDGSRVALKVLRPHVIGDDEARERLAREVASLRRVRSPRIAEVLDADPWGATPFVATRYVPGLSLHEQVRQDGPIRGDDLRYFAEGLAEAVLAVHSVGVLHRDIKPSNVLLEGRSPVLIDFGLARLTEDPRLTVTGWLLGTPGYLAPEILYGEDATTASDVHSWGATVAFAATGRPPFGRGPAMAIMDRVRRGEHDLDDVPPELRPLVHAALAPDPAARPSLPSLLADVRRRPPRGRGYTEDLTMPYAVAAALPDDDPTDVLGADGYAARTTPLTTSMTPSTTAVHRPAREPYMQPAPPARPVAPARETHPEHPPLDVPPAPVNGAAPLQRGVLRGGLLALVAMAFGLAPYLTLGGLTLAALVLRTWSWTTESSDRRAWARGRRRWYDGPLAALTSPWYLLVAAGGTLVLMLWAAAWAFLVGLGMLLFRAPLEPGLIALGAVTGLAMWWGPGARRLRTPTRQLVRAGTRSAWVGWLAVLLVLGGAALMALAVAGNGVTWDPQPGPPWRAGTLLGELVRYL